jgi:hypothetical protein
MSRRDFFALGGAAGAAVAGLSLTEAMSGRRDQPNFLVIMTDDQPYYTVDRTKRRPYISFSKTERSA